LPERVKRRSDYIIVLTGHLRVDVNARLINPAAAAHTRGNRVSRRDCALRRKLNKGPPLSRALEESWSTIGAAQRTVKKAEAAVEEAKVDAASRLAASMIVSAVAAPVSAGPRGTRHTLTGHLVLHQGYQLGQEVPVVEGHDRAHATPVANNEGNKLAVKPYGSLSYSR